MNQLGPESRRIIREGSAADLPDAEAEARIWNAISQGRHAPLSPEAETVAHALSPTTLSKLAWLGAKSVWLGAGVTVLTAALLWNRASLEPQVTKPPSASAPVREGLPLASRAEERERAESESETRSTRGARSGPKPLSTLSAESALLARAQRALHAGRPERALALSDEHSRRFPRGALTPEREVLHILALCALGRREAADAERALFLRERAASPLTHRLAQPCTNR